MAIPEGAPVFFFPAPGWFVLGRIIDGEPVPLEGPMPERTTLALLYWEETALGRSELEGAHQVLRYKCGICGDDPEVEWCNGCGRGWAQR